MNLIGAYFESQAKMRHQAVTRFVVTEKVSRLIEAAAMKSLADDPPEPDEEIVLPPRGKSIE
ncbi:hypothetical protein [Pseudomonas alvandae]|uniref:hypothetical protein n=1 Tax=Pseudomonas canavaninivorans TaxID=2842348 RepID=UPI003D647AD8